jgi:hypothetical protein
MINYTSPMSCCRSLQQRKPIPRLPDRDEVAGYPNRSASFVSLVTYAGQS